MSFEDARLESEAGVVITEMWSTIESYTVLYSRSGVCQGRCIAWFLSEFLISEFLTPIVAGPF
jgi:hypothetical protein